MDGFVIAFITDEFRPGTWFLSRTSEKYIQVFKAFAIMAESMEPIVFVTAQNDQGRRLDRVLRKLFKNEPLSFIYKALREKKIVVNGEKSTPDYRCQNGDRIEVYIPLDSNYNNESISAPLKTTGLGSIQNMILLETQDLLVLNKPGGMLTHDGINSLDTLVRAYYQSSHSDTSLSFKPGPLHRLDRNTSGIITFSKSLEGARHFSAALREGKLRKIYLAVLEGCFVRPESWSDALERNKNNKKTQRARSHQDSATKSARTDVWPLATHDTMTFAALELHSGRTHQIRAHASIHGHPLAGDRKYGSSTHFPKYFLHAWYLDLSLCMLSDIPQTIMAPLPAEFELFLFKHLCMSEKSVYSILDTFLKQR